MATRGPIPHTCPDINAQQKSNEAMMNEIKSINLMRTTPEEIDNLLDNIRDLLKDNNSTLEDMRDNNDRLRTWGAEMEDAAANWEAQANELQNELSSLPQHV